MNPGWFVVMVYLLGSWNCVASAEETDIYAACDSLWAKILQLNTMPVGELSFDLLGSKTIPKGYHAGLMPSPDMSETTCWSPPKVEGVPYQEIYERLENRMLPDSPVTMTTYSWEDEHFLERIYDDNGFWKFLSRRLVFYRTLSFPRYWLTNDCAPVNCKKIVLRFHHRKIETIEIDDLHFLALMRMLAADQLVYAGLLGLNDTSDNRFAEFYLLMTGFETEVRHFFKIAETYEVEADTFSVSSLSLDLYPFIRTDNLKSLYADPEINETPFREPVRLEKP